jgi:hypothetical protein
VTQTTTRAAAARCGTTGGYKRHQRNGEAPCNACVRAKAEYDVRWRNAPDDTRRILRLRARAQGRAETWLRQNHPGEYRQLYEAALAEVFAEHGVTQ